MVTGTKHVRLMNFLVPKIDSCEYSLNRPNKSVFHVSRGYSKTILNQAKEEQETVVRTGVESRDHSETTSAQVEACKGNDLKHSV